MRFLKMYSKKQGDILTVFIKVEKDKPQKFLFKKMDSDDEFQKSWDSLSEILVQLGIWDSFDKEWPGLKEALRRCLKIKMRDFVLIDKIPKWRISKPDPGNYHSLPGSEEVKRLVSEDSKPIKDFSSETKPKKQHCSDQPFPKNGRALRTLKPAEPVTKKTRTISHGSGVSSLGLILDDIGPIGVPISTKYTRPREKGEVYLDSFQKTNYEQLKELNNDKEL